MLSFEEQAKILGPILQRENNRYCADCGSHSPTWASLDFGVFVCSNCSGSHRALGPTITRIKSTKLDQWNSAWLNNMQLGNLLINKFWEADDQTAFTRKPKSGASLDEHNRYVVEKYVRRKFVLDKNKSDPLTAFKNGESIVEETSKSEPERQNICNIPVSQPAIPNLNANLTKKFSENITAKSNNNFNLLDDHHFEIPKEQTMQKNHEIPLNVVKQNNEKLNQNDDDDEFTDYIESTPQNNSHHLQNNASTNVQTIETKQPSQMSFDDLLKGSAQQTQQQQAQFNQPQWQGQNQWGNNHNINSQMQWSQHQHQHHHFGSSGSYGLQAHCQYHQNNFQNGQFTNQFIHNPYIGYTPHTQLHAAHNLHPAQNSYKNFNLY